MKSNIDIKTSNQNIEYFDALNFMEKRVDKILCNEENEMLWFLNHNHVYTCGTSAKKNEILGETNIPILQTNRGGKTTYHGPGQRVVYFMINLNKRKKDIRKFIRVVEDSIIETLKEYKIDSFNDRKNIGIWVNHNKKVKKVAAIGIRVSKWIAYHGFSININNDLDAYKKIIPCGITDKDVSNLKEIKNQNYDKIGSKIINNFIKNLEN